MVGWLEVGRFLLSGWKGWGNIFLLVVIEKGLPGFIGTSQFCKMTVLSVCCHFQD
jgi:hypothetical protein